MQRSQIEWKCDANLLSRFFSTTHTHGTFLYGYALFPHSTQITSLNARLMMSKQTSEKSDECKISREKFFICFKFSALCWWCFFDHSSEIRQGRRVATLLFFSSIVRAACCVWLVRWEHAMEISSLKISERWRVKSIISWINFSSIVWRHLSLLPWSSVSWELGWSHLIISWNVSRFRLDWEWKHKSCINFSWRVARMFMNNWVHSLNRKLLQGNSNYVSKNCASFIVDLVLRRR